MPIGVEDINIFKAGLVVIFMGSGLDNAIVVAFLMIGVHELGTGINRRVIRSAYEGAIRAAIYSKALEGEGITPEAITYANVAIRENPINDGYLVSPEFHFVVQN